MNRVVILIFEEINMKYHIINVNIVNDIYNFLAQIGYTNSYNYPIIMNLKRCDPDDLIINNQIYSIYT